MCGKIPPIEARERRVAQEEIRKRHLESLLEVHGQWGVHSEFTKSLEDELCVCNYIIGALDFKNNQG